MIIGTAGHIDHGKSALVTALTGRPMDRLAEEQRRGITIDLNFAPLRLDGLPPAGIVDVPGHEDFVRTMVAGASGIDLVLLVIDAAQGPGPQTWEHLAIVEALGIPRGIPVITKADLADPDWLELVASETAERLADSPVAFEAAAIVSAVTRQGIADLLERLRRLAAAIPPRDGRDGFRLPVDRAFSLAGVGTVVTGTAWSGSVRPGDQVLLLPSGRPARVRSVESFGEAVAASLPGARTAVGLAGLDRQHAARGDVLVSGPVPWRATQVVDAEVSLLPDATKPLGRRRRVRFHLGTAEILARAYPREEIAPGGTALCRLVLEAPTVARGGDRFVLRSYSPVTTMGGGRVLDPDPPRRAGWSSALAAVDPAERLAALVERRAIGLDLVSLPLVLGVPPDAAARLTAAGGQVVAKGGTLLAVERVAGLEEAALGLVRRFHQSHPSERGLSAETLRSALRAPPAVVADILEGLNREGRLKRTAGIVSLSGFKPKLAAGGGEMERVLKVLDEAGLEPPTVAELERQLGLSDLLTTLRFAADQGKAVAVERDRYFSPPALERFVAAVREVGAEGDLTPSRLRDRLGLSRKYLIPLLEWADRTGVTRRVGENRVIL